MNAFAIKPAQNINTYFECLNIFWFNYTDGLMDPFKRLLRFENKRKNVIEIRFEKLNFSRKVLLYLTNERDWKIIKHESWIKYPEHWRW